MIRAMLSGLLLIVWLMASTVEAADKSDWVDGDDDDCDHRRSQRSVYAHLQDILQRSQKENEIKKAPATLTIPEKE